jgi:predicted nucleotidyltransferase
LGSGCAPPDLRRRYGVARLALHGSFAHGQPGKDSDLDLLVELERPLGLEFVNLAEDLERRLGLRVDLATFGVLSRSMEHPRSGQIPLALQRTLIHVAREGVQVL